MPGQSRHPELRREQHAREVLEWGGRIAAPLRASFPSLDIEQIQDAIAEAIVDWCDTLGSAPAPYPPALLYRAAWRNARDMSSSEISRAERERAWSSRRPTQTTAGALDHKGIEEAIRSIHELLPDERLKAVFRLSAVGERRFRRYADALGLSNTASVDPRRIVKREKDRLDKHLRRDPRVRAIAADVLHEHEIKVVSIDGTRSVQPA